MLMRYMHWGYNEFLQLPIEFRSVLCEMINEEARQAELEKLRAQHR